MRPQSDWELELGVELELEVEVGFGVDPDPDPDLDLGLGLEFGLGLVHGVGAGVGFPWGFWPELGPGLGLGLGLGLRPGVGPWCEHRRDAGSRLELEHEADLGLGRGLEREFDFPHRSEGIRKLELGLRPGCVRPPSQPQPALSAPGILSCDRYRGLERGPDFRFRSGLRRVELELRLCYEGLARPALSAAGLYQPGG